VGDYGIILKTTDGGAQWTAQTSGTNERLYSVYSTDANTGYAVGGFDYGHGTILKTIDGGAHWTVQASGTNFIPRSVCFTDSNTGYVVGDYGTILKTTNGGASFIEEAKPESFPYTLYPNPAKDNITLSCNTTLKKEMHVRVYHISGQEVLRYKVENKNKAELDVSALMPGLYLVCIDEGNSHETLKFVKE